VFEVLEDTCIIRPAALKPDFTKPRTDSIVDAAEECPVDVIKFETVTEEVADAAPATEEAPAEPAEPAKAEASKAPEAPAPKKAEPAKAAAKAPAAHASMAGDPDPAIAALLRAATARGGNAGMLKSGDIGARAGKQAAGGGSNLPPEARQAKVHAVAKKASEEMKEGRRAFVGSGFLALGWVAFGAGTGLAVGPAFGRFMMPNVLEEPDPRVRVGKLSKYVEMPVGAVNEDHKPQGIWMIRLDGRIAALSTICTHLGCIPNWLPNEHKFKCPCHGSGYYQNGINFEGPTPRPLERFKLYVKGGIVVVDKSKKYQQELGQWNMPGSYIEV
jgi:cytochrome b6-f complex iron-sulfur subunit